MTKQLSAVQISQLTAIITGGEYKRAANRDAAAKRFLKVADEAGISAPTAILDMSFDAASAVIQTELSAANAASEPVAKPAAKRKAAPAAAAETDTNAVDEAMQKFERASAKERDADFMRDLFREVFEAGRAARSRRSTGRSGPTKREIAANLLQRPEGCTTRDILDATGWPAVSVPAIAKASGLTLRQEKDGRATRYYGEPF